MTNESRDYEAPGQPIAPVKERINRAVHHLVVEAGYGRLGTWNSAMMEAVKAGVQIVYDEVIAAGELNSEACKQVAKVYREIEQEQLRWMGPDPMAKVRDEMMGAIWAAFEFVGVTIGQETRLKVAAWLKSVYGDGFSVGTVTQEEKAKIEKEDLRRRGEVARVDTGDGTARIQINRSAAQRQFDEKMKIAAEAEGVEYPFGAGLSESSSTSEAVVEDLLATARHAVKVGNSSLLDVTAARLGQILLERGKKEPGGELGGGR